MSSTFDPSSHARGSAEHPAGHASAHRDGAGNGDREVAVLLAVSRALTAWDSFDTGSERLLAELAGALDLPAGALWLPHEEALVARTVWSMPGVDHASLEGMLRQIRLTRGSGLPGSVWDRREPLDAGISSADEPATRADRPVQGLRGAIGLPLLAGEEVLGVVELYAAARWEFSARLMHVLTAVGQLLGAFFARRRGQLRPSPLTVRELEVLTLAAQGLAGRKIAEQLSISPATVKTHCEHIYAKLGVVNRTAAVGYALRAGLIQ
jgi:DNA-binding CsgD family transcriptional regulator